jgi:hypothetical protein
VADVRRVLLLPPESVGCGAGDEGFRRGGRLGPFRRAGWLDSCIAQNCLRCGPIGQRPVIGASVAARDAGARNVRLGRAQCAVWRRDRVLFFAVRVGDERVLSIARMDALRAGGRQLDSC